MPKRSRKSLIAKPEDSIKCSNAPKDVYDFDIESASDKKCFNITKPPEIKINDKIYNEAVKNNIDDCSDFTSEKVNRRGRRQLTKAGQTAFSSTPTLKQQRLKMNKMKGQELAEFCESSQKKNTSFDSKNDEKKNIVQVSSPALTGSVSLQFASQQCPKRISRFPCETGLDKLYSSLDNLAYEKTNHSNNCSSNSSLASLDLNSYNKRIDLSDDENEHNNNQDLNGELNDSDAQNCQAMQFNSITFVVNSRSEIANNQWIILYLIEKISEFHRKNVSSSVASESKLEIAIYDIVSNELAASDELSTLELFLEENFANPKDVKLIFVKEFKKAFANKLVISLVSSTWKLDDEEDSTESVISPYTKYEENLYEEKNDLSGLRYICFGISSYDNSLFCHYHFAFNKAVYLEAPVLFPTEQLEKTNYKNEIYKNSKIYISTYDPDSYMSTCNMFDMFDRKTIFKCESEELGIPSVHTSVMQSFLAELTKPFRKINDTILQAISKNKTIENVNELPNKNYLSDRENSFKAIIFNYMKSNISSEIDRFLHAEKVFNVELK